MNNWGQLQLMRNKVAMSVSEKEKYLSILKFALEKKGVPKISYCIRQVGDSSCNYGVCLVEGKDQYWTIENWERGKLLTTVNYSSLFYAVRDFYLLLIRHERPSPWDYLREWELETGLQFDLYNRPKRNINNTDD